MSAAGQAQQADDVCAECGCDGACGAEQVFDPAPRRVREWLDRQRCKPGGVTPEQRALVELLISDLEAGDF